MAAIQDKIVLELARKIIEGSSDLINLSTSNRQLFSILRAILIICTEYPELFK